jgi:hypothetical protein
MIIIKLVGGLGNQMFQYSLGRKLSILNKTKLKFDVSDLSALADNKILTKRDYGLDKFCVDGSFLTDQELSIFKHRRFNNFQKIVDQILPIQKKTFVFERNLYFNKAILKIKSNTYLDGYWQSPLYFDDIRDVLISDFKISFELENDAKLTLKDIEDSNSVSVHIRRGDYLKLANIYHILDLNYYYDSIRYLSEKYSNLKFFIFSDDIKWCKENIKLENVSFVTSNEPYLDLFLMSKCKHNIIANSSFSWWSAWLNQNCEKIVIGPRKWFVNNKIKMDILPNEWIKL